MEGADSLHWDYSNITGGSYPASFAVTALEQGPMPDPTKAGVYGWRVRDKNNVIVGGVQYPWQAGDANKMELGGYFTGARYGGNPFQGGPRYEVATVDLGLINMTLNEADYPVFAENIRDSYTLEIFFVDTNAEFDAAKGAYPCAWIQRDIEVKHTRWDEQNRTHTFTLQVKGLDDLHWDWIDNGPGPAVFNVTVTEPERITTNRVTAWGVETPGANAYLNDNTVSYRADPANAYRNILDWSYSFKTPAKSASITDADMKPFVDSFKEHYQLRVTYVNYWTQNDENNPLYLSLPIRDMTIVERGDGYVVLKVTPMIAHNLRWHWRPNWTDTNDDWSATSVDAQYNLNFRIRVQIVNEISDETAKAHLVTNRVVNPPSTTVNFFDYWLEPNGRWANDFEAYPMGTESEVIKKGINNGHLLVFMGSFAFPGAEGCNNVSNLGRWNVWTGDEHFAPYPDGNANVNGGYGSAAGRFTQGADGILKPHRGIVAKTLDESGYPRLSLGNNAWLNSAAFAGGNDYSNIYPDSMGGQFRTYFADVLEKDTQNARGEYAKGEESLAYLFDPSISNPYKASVTDVTGLFQMDNEGYYFFNSRENFAELDEEAHTVKLYDMPWKISASVDVDNDNGNAMGQFFPFNKWATLFHETGNGTEVSQDHYNFRDQNSSMVRPINHYFGMTVETEFQQPIGGTITQGRLGGGQDIPMEFYFSGDDDVWIFIDDVLVGDIGGIHNPVSININFATGVIEYKALDAPNGLDGTAYYTTSLKAMFDAAVQTRANSVNWVEVDNGGEKGYIFPNGSIHTLKFYYMERGNDVSDCSIRFNTLPVSKDSIRKVDDDGAILEGALFNLYEAAPNGTLTTDAWHTVSEFNKVNADAPIAKGLRINNDKENPNLYTVLDEHNKAIDFTAYVANPNVPAYFILEEVQVPAGFHGNPDIVLEFHPETYTFTVVNKYEAGAYASFSAEWKQLLAVSEATFNETTGELEKRNDIATQTDPDPMKEGLTVVVPLIKSGGTWRPMYGSNTIGWSTVERGNGTLKTDLALAALLQIAGDDYQNWYMNWIDTGASVGKLVGNMANLPGDATRYVINQNSGNRNADLTLVALFLPKDTLNKLGVVADAAATDDDRYEALRRQLIASGVTNLNSARSFLQGKNTSENSFRLLYSNDFARSYRTVIYISNNRRELRVRKVDEEGKPVNGAVFALFESAASAAAYTPKATDLNGVMAELAGAVGKGGLKTYGVTATVDLGVSDRQQDGLLVFQESAPGTVTTTNGHAPIPGVQNTVYWLKEVYAPNGYELNKNLVRVEVNDSAIYANATGYDAAGNILTGDAAVDDGITVQGTLGKLAQMLTKYAIGDKVDATLQDITIIKQVSQHKDALPADGSGWSDAQPAESLNAHYGVNVGTLNSQYGLHEAAANPGVFTAEDGYIRGMPRQNQTKYGDHDQAVKRDNLAGVDLDGLFRLVNVVVVENRKLGGDLTVSKTVTGTDGDQTQEFSFLILLSDVTISGTYGDMTFQQGTATFTLKHGESKTATGLPAGIRYSVTELSANQDGYVTSSIAASGTIPENDGAVAAFVNARDKVEVPQTSDRSHPGWWLTMAVLSLLGMIVVMKKKQAK